MNIPKFSNTPRSFHSELKKRINEYFEQGGKSATGNYKLYIKAIVLVISFLAVYVHLIFFTPTPWLAIVECFVFGGLVAAIGFNVMHDGAHGSFSRYKWLNDLAALSVNFLGANNFMWKIKHNVIHHAYTNIDGVDDDIDARPMLRLCETQKYYKIHRYQHLYFWAAYSLLKEDERYGSYIILGIQSSSPCFIYRIADLYGRFYAMADRFSYSRFICRVCFEYRFPVGTYGRAYTFPGCEC